MVTGPTPGKASPETEVEWQLDALDLRPVERWLTERARAGSLAAGLPISLTPQPAKRLVDTYVDTEDWRVGRSGYVLRIRKRSGKLEATLKDRSEASGGLRRRFEATQAFPPTPTGARAAATTAPKVPRADTPTASRRTSQPLPAIAALDPEGPVGRRVRALANGRRFVQLVEVHTRRQPFDLVIDGETVGEVALDDTSIVLPNERRRLRLQRVEVEVSPEHVESLRPMVQRLRAECGLKPATLSKFEAGLMAAGLTIPQAADLGPTAVEPSSTTGEVAYAVIRRDAAAMVGHEPGTRLGEDIEALHQMRVSTRRMRAALDLFADVLPARAAHFRAELGWLAGVLGTVRDLDIQLSHFATWNAEVDAESAAQLAELEVLLAGHRDEARVELLDALDSRRYERLCSGLFGMLRSGPLRRSPHSRQPATVAMVPLISARHEAALKAARRARRSGIAADYHRLRIRCKRLRYSLEFTTGLYDDELRPYARRLAKLQDELGLMQDAEVAAQRLSGIVLSPDGEALSRQTIFVMGRLAERYRAESEKRLGGLPGFLNCLRSPEANKAMATMARRKAEAERLAQPVAMRPTRVPFEERVSQPRPARRTPSAVAPPRRAASSAQQQTTPQGSPSSTEATPAPGDVTAAGEGAGAPADAGPGPASRRLLSDAGFRANDEPGGAMATRRILPSSGSAAHPSVGGGPRGDARITPFQHRDPGGGHNRGGRPPG